jgi:hypothetical protein
MTVSVATIATYSIIHGARKMRQTTRTGVNLVNCATCRGKRREPPSLRARDPVARETIGPRPGPNFNGRLCSIPKIYRLDGLRQAKRGPGTVLAHYKRKNSELSVPLTKREDAGRVLENAAVEEPWLQSDEYAHASRQIPGRFLPKYVPARSRFRSEGGSPSLP